jgi:SNF2 family DNA or RNA helicase
VSAVRLGVADGRITLHPLGHLDEEFDAYRDAARAGGARYDRDARKTVCAPECAARTVAALKAAGFAVIASTEARSALWELAEKIGMEEQTTLRRLDQIEERTGWRFRGYQRDGAVWLAGRRGAILADEMGLGKSCQVLAALPESARAVIVCPAVVIGVWVKECARMRPDLRVTVARGRRGFDRWPSAGEVIVASYESLPDVMPVGDVPVLTLIADEAHALKNGRSGRSRRWGALAAVVRAARGATWCVTATPLTDEPFDLWNVALAAGVGEVIFGGWMGFLRAFNAEETEYGIRFGSPEPSLGAEIARGMLRRAKGEVLSELPPKTYQTLDVDVSGETLATCNEALAAWDASKLEDLNALARSAEFEKIARARRALAGIKTAHALAYCKQADAPMLAFSAHVGPVMALGGLDGWASITGAMEPEARTALVEAFQHGDLRGLALTIGAGGVGITLTRATEVLFVDLAWTPALNEQAEDRAHRIGQRDHVIVRRIVADHDLDRRMLEVLGGKQDLIAASVDRATISEKSSFLSVSDSLRTLLKTGASHGR